MEDDEDQDMPTLPVQKCSKNKQLIRQLTPSGSLANLSSKRGRVNSMASIPEPGNQSSPDTLGIKSIINCISTKEERIESEERAARTQENLTIKLANSMSTMITTNREKELAMKKSIAFEEMNTKRALARSQMIVDLIGKGMDPTAAEQMALRHLPDIDHSHTPNSTSNDS
ncbi:uncharacterized protein MELLADRAFT_57742 [Melampsora larici-populina 98AG31]|uniref:No apical meristem-associated C-terminal domain-containing protein n=1 Tax=Melampsora larici-populina (strain 98AG31 / pathotype 3-4-7) TaxID=747676 RepID=F4S669_MELLP|nr:uncharacterized protein MELLADRAFT_57742 [Melampsora larici-populina 98AG31]EGF99882.1 hypothetical protein MELLADRAFT_57742 [Melampsora larici-populina 98AG31]